MTLTHLGRMQTVHWVNQLPNRLSFLFPVPHNFRHRVVQIMQWKCSKLLFGSYILQYNWKLLSSLEKIYHNTWASASKQWQYSVMAKTLVFKSYGYTEFTQCLQMKLRYIKWKFQKFPVWNQYASSVNVTVNIWVPCKERNLFTILPINNY